MRAWRNISFAHQNTTGFTLVELLVVVGIIVLLISILLPVLTKARAAAKCNDWLASLVKLNGAMNPIG